MNDQTQALGGLFVRCYLEEYTNENGQSSVRLREKLTGRRIEMWTIEGNLEFLLFMSAIKRLSLAFAEVHETQFFSRFGFVDYVVVRGDAALDTYDVLRFEAHPVSYMTGPTSHSDFLEKSLSVSPCTRTYLRHAQTADRAFREGDYRSSAMSTRLAIEAVCLSGKRAKTGGDSVKYWAGKAEEIDSGGSVVASFQSSWAARNNAVHESSRLFDRSEARDALKAMNEIINFVLSFSGDDGVE